MKISKLPSDAGTVVFTIEGITTEKLFDAWHHKQEKARLFAHPFKERYNCSSYRMKYTYPNGSVSEAALHPQSLENPMWSRLDLVLL